MTCGKVGSVYEVGKQFVVGGAWARGGGGCSAVQCSAGQGLRNNCGKGWRAAEQNRTAVQSVDSTVKCRVFLGAVGVDRGGGVGSIETRR